MRILSRYVFRQTAGALLLILLSLTGVTWIAIALRQLELLTSQGQDAMRFLAMTTLAIPTLMAMIAPVALLIAAIHVINRLNGDSELIVMTSGGMPAWALLKPLSALALLVGLGIAVVNHALGPWAQQKLRALAVEVRTDLMSQVIQPWRFTSPEAKLTVHIRDRSPSGELLGLLMHDGRDPKQVVTYLAERGLIIKQDDVAYLRMDKGHVVRRLADDPTPQIVAFDQYVVDLSQLEQRMDTTVYFKPRERYTSELIWPDENDPVYRVNPGGFRSELHDRLSAPLYAFAFVLVVVAFIGQAQTTRTSRVQALVGAFAVAVIFRVLGIAAANAAVVRPQLSLLLYAAPLGAAALGAAVTQWHLYPRRPSRLVAAAGGFMERAGDALGRTWGRMTAPGAPQRTRG